ncbi:MAG: dihydrodipicolinate synthase family protein, partial [Clostridiales bacterium]|nr:dihydrodipicolinate synthase family protein [Clostridiales bacterium]
SGDLKRAAILNDRLIPITNARFMEVNPIPVKAGMNLLGFAAGVPRSPLTPLTEEHLQILRAALNELGAEVVS